ncbi:uncharacterized protein [Rutidosis leptorrhynchoides]|uniref:uncharacterized protein n=1 Tax=Rutidosis leptorrhynchoides TaxID=125765 RepID=UPI003A9A3435
MESQGKIEDSVLSPSFSYYSSDTSTTSTSIARVIHEDEEDFEFSIGNKQLSLKDISSKSWTIFPVFNRDLIINDEIDHSVSINSPLRKLFINEEQLGSESPSYSSSEADELENIPSGTFCVWSPKCKKSNSTGSSTGSKKWSIRYLLKRSNSDGKEPTAILKRKPTRNFGDDVLTSKAQTPVHELFYVKRRSENEIGKRKTYLPYRKDLVGLFGNVNGIGKIIPF